MPLSGSKKYALMPSVGAYYEEEGGIQRELSVSTTNRSKI
jgi:hypothetical protein